MTSQLHNPSLKSDRELLEKIVESSGEPVLINNHPVSIPRSLFDDNGKLSHKKAVKLADAICSDYRDCEEEWDLDIQSEMKEILLPQSVLGHFINGHCQYNVEGDKFCIPDLTMGFVIASLGWNLEEFKRLRQKSIDDVYDCVNKMVDSDKEYVRFTNGDGEPLFGMNFFRDTQIHRISGLQGMLCAGRMDSAEWREKTMQHYQKNFQNNELLIGTGTVMNIDLRALYEWGSDSFALSYNDHTDEEMDIMRSNGVISESRTDYTEPIFIRRKIGPGTSDDVALCYIGRKFGTSGYLGAVLVDAIDTYDKYATESCNGGQDERLADILSERWKAKHESALVEDEDIMELIYMAAKSNYPKISISSSHRRFVQYQPVEEEQPMTTVDLHKEYLNGVITPGAVFGYERMGSVSFYEKVTERFGYLKDLKGL